MCVCVCVNAPTNSAHICFSSRLHWLALAWLLIALHLINGIQSGRRERERREHSYVSEMVHTHSWVTARVRADIPHDACAHLEMVIRVSVCAIASASSSNQISMRWLYILIVYIRYVMFWTSFYNRIIVIRVDMNATHTHTHQIGVTVPDFIYSPPASRFRATKSKLVRLVWSCAMTAMVTIGCVDVSFTGSA